MAVLNFHVSKESCFPSELLLFFGAMLVGKTPPVLIRDVGKRISLWEHGVGEVELYRNLLCAIKNIVGACEYIDRRGL